MTRSRKKVVKKVVSQEPAPALFDTNSYTSTPLGEVFTDPAWDDGSAWAVRFSEDGKEKKSFSKGDRVVITQCCQYQGVSGTIESECDDKGFLVVPDQGFFGSDGYRLSKCYFHPDFLEVAPTETEDRWNPAHFGDTPFQTEMDGQLTIFWDSNEPPEPDDYATMQEYEEAWQKWERLHNLTSAQELEQDCHSLDSNLELNLSDSARTTNTVETSLVSGFQESKSRKMSGTCAGTTSQSSPLLSVSGGEESLTLSPPALPANPSQFKEIEKEAKTCVTASQQSSESLKSSSPNSSASKTSSACSTVPTNQEESCCISSGCLNDFPISGTMRNGYLFPADTLPLPSLEEDYFWLESPGALSSNGNGRPPGLNRLETFLKRKGLLNKGEVLNPDILSDWYSLPQSWLDPSESRAATELLGNKEQLQETCLTHEWPPLPSVESSTSTSFSLDDTQSPVIPKILLEDSEVNTVASISSKNLEYLATPEKFLEENQAEAVTDISSKKKPGSGGCLYRYLEHKKLKSGQVVSYPRVAGDRDPDNPKHWRWGFNWEEKLDGEWKGRSIGSIPPEVVPMIRMMQKHVSLEKIISFIKKSKHTRASSKGGKHASSPKRG